MNCLTIVFIFKKKDTLLVVWENDNQRRARALPKKKKAKKLSWTDAWTFCHYLYFLNITN